MFRSELTKISRLLSGTVAPHLAALPGDEFAPLLLDQLGGVRASLTLLTRSRAGTTEVVLLEGGAPTRRTLLMPSGR
jgi:hypothetical protein